MLALIKRQWVLKFLKRLVVIIAAFFLMYLISYLIDPFSEYWKTFFTRNFKELVTDVIATLIISLVLCECSLWLNNKLNTILLWTQHPISRFVIESILNLALSLFINLIIFFFFLIIDDNIATITSNYPFSLEEKKGLIHWWLVNFCLTFMLMSIHTGNYLILNWKNEALKTSELSRIAAEAEIQALKMQIDPHFVFNNLSVLSELILIDQQMGYEYAEKFSKIYRYMLINAKKNTIQLKDELSFLNDYIFLIQTRIGKGVHFKINIPEAYLSMYLPPMTLQLLVENALKHNKTHKEKPLEIVINAKDDNQLCVENIIQPLESSISSSKIGLENIKSRYQLLSNRQPKIEDNGHSFIVTIPLL